jgi:hypothetical protein
MHPLARWLSDRALAYYKKEVVKRVSSLHLFTVIEKRSSSYVVEGNHGQRHWHGMIMMTMLTMMMLVMMIMMLTMMPVMVKMRMTMMLIMSMVVVVVKI